MQQLMRSVLAEPLLARLALTTPALTSRLPDPALSQPSQLATICTALPSRPTLPSSSSSSAGPSTWGPSRTDVRCLHAKVRRLIKKHPRPIPVSWVRPWMKEPELRRQHVPNAQRPPGDPDSQVYSAPVPIEGKAKKGIPRVLLWDPWLPVEKIEYREQLIRVVLAELRSWPPGEKMTASQFHQHLLDKQARYSATELTPGDSAPPPVPSYEYIRELLEYLRKHRLVSGIANPSADCVRGHPLHDYYYCCEIPYQKMIYGAPQQAQAKLDRYEAKRLEIARKRVQAGKPPFQIHRQVARSSIFQHLLAYEQADKVKETMQLQPLSQPALEQ